MVCNLRRLQESERLQESGRLQKPISLVLLAAGALMASACPGLGRCDEPEVLSVPFESISLKEATIDGYFASEEGGLPRGATVTVTVSLNGGAPSENSAENYESTRVASAELIVDREAGRVTRRYLDDEGRQVEEVYRITAEAAR